MSVCLGRVSENAMMLVGAMVAAFWLATQPAAAAEGTITAAQASDVSTLDPTVDTAAIGVNIRNNIFDQLTEITAEGKIIPRLATAWESSEGGTSWTFTIRSGARFHDGSPVSADDVVWTYRKIMTDTKSPARTYLSNVSSVEQTADGKVRFKLSEPFAPFDRQVSLISVVSRKAYEAMGPAQFGRTPVGSGPFKVVDWVKDDRVTLEAFDGYWGDKPTVKTVVFRPVPSESSRASALVAGDIDIVPVLPPALTARLSTNPDVNVVKLPSHKIVYVGFNVTKGALQNVKFRQAVDHAIDRDAITEKLLRGMGKPAGHLMAPVSFGYDASIKPTTYDPALAKKLIAESGYNGEKILFQFPSNNLASGGEVAQAIAGYLQAVGINVELQGSDYTAFFQLWAQRKLDGLYLFAYGPTIMDADLPLASLFETGRTRGYWQNDEVDALIKAQRGETDPVKRQALISKIWKIVAENVPYASLYNEIQSYGIRKRVSWTPRPNELLLFKDARIGK